MNPPERMAERVDLSQRHTLGCPGTARWLIDVDSEQAVFPVLEWAGETGLPVHVLGGGSNVLVPDNVPGLVLVNALRGIRLLGMDSETVRVEVAAGMDWHDWVLRASAAGWYGLENLALIPGTVGAAPVQNIGAYGVEVGQFVESVQTVNLSSGVTKTWRASACGFAYRHSVFKAEQAGRWLITAVRFRLKRQFEPVLDYGPLLRATPASVASSQALVQTVTAIRQSKLPDPGTVPNAGSFFTNPIVPAPEGQRLAAQYPEAPHFPMDDGRIKFAAGWMIEQCGMRGYTDPRTGIGTYRHQSLILINPRQQPLAEILGFARSVRERVYQRFGVWLEVEPQRLDRT